jgi:pimeloyl-ACP methyl ester carboxylesterase
MSSNILMIHGNGGANTRFQLFVEQVRQEEAPIKVFLPELPGFEGRPLPESKDYWSLFLKTLGQLILSDRQASWIIYGHGIGGSLVLEWAARNWILPDRTFFRPQQVILHGIIGASLEQRLFPKLMQWKPLRHFLHRMIYASWLQPVWERRLFIRPQAIPQSLRNQFFTDYKNCAAFPVFFDLITPAWYRQVQKATVAEPFHFIWGSKERVVAAKFLEYWKKDYPNATFEVVEGWDHFPMLEQPEAFYQKMLERSDA